jgi:type II secretory pathway component PulJ
MPTEISVALISGIAIIAAAVLPAVLIQSLRKENSDDHQYVRRILTRVERKLDNHLEDHENGTTRRTKTKHQ